MSVDSHTDLLLVCVLLFALLAPVSADSHTDLLLVCVLLFALLAPVSVDSHTDLLLCLRDMYSISTLYRKKISHGISIELVSIELLSMQLSE